MAIGFGSILNNASELFSAKKAGEEATTAGERTAVEATTIATKKADEGATATATASQFKYGMALGYQCLLDNPHCGQARGSKGERGHTF